MTSKTSFFNKGIYKSVLKRYAWGSVLYFVILFLFTALAIITTNHFRPAVGDTEYYSRNPLILSGSYLGLPQLLAIVVPSVAALLVMRFIHSRKQVVFTHALPVSRKANYISSVFGGFTLMAVPIVLNTLILMLISVCGYGEYFSVSNCITWLLINLAAIFMMYSCAIFSSVITGNSFAMIVINIIIHSFLFVAVSALNVMAEAFVYGISDINPIIDAVAENNFVSITMAMSQSHFREAITLTKILIYALITLAIYIGSYFIYKFRKSETASDVAGFKKLSAVLKYLVTFLVTLFAFAAIGYDITSNAAAIVATLVITSMVAYFGSEMLLKKTLNVIRSYKGYICYAVFFALLTAVFSLTSFFGYETRIPEKGEIAEVAIYNYYYMDNEPFTDDAKITDLVLSAHERLTQDIPRVYDRFYDTRLHIRYKLTDGSEMSRIYPMTYEVRNEIMNEIYKDDEYKKKSEPIFTDDSMITRVYINGEGPIENKSELVEAIRQDTDSLSFEDLHPAEGTVYKEGVFVHTVYIEYEGTDDSGRVFKSAHIEITDKYVNTLRWIKENGYQR